MAKRFAIRTVALIAGLSFLSWPAVAAEIYHMDQGHTEVIFAWSHSGVSMQHGEFTKARGTLSLDPKQVENSTIEVTIDANSLSTGVPALDTHLKSKDYLEVATYPEITFKSTSVTRTGEATADVVGDLTLHGVTKPVTLKAKLTHRGAHPVGQYIDYYKGAWVAFKVTTKIDHQAFKVGRFSTGTIYIEINTELKDRE